MKTEESVMRGQAVAQNIQFIPPGSPEAVEHGCRCPIIDNHHGKGVRDRGNQFVIEKRCPLHGSGEVKV